ncbi:MAG: cytochrome P450 [Paracoccaceae bacterium]|uniref:cytochrome P450 n=1 Tax=Sulfitobacter pontiacus TaxID=60137 RepID=UPI00326CBB72
MKDITQVAPPSEAILQPNTKAFARDPHSVYAQLRALETPYLLADFDGYVFSRFDDVRALALCPDMVRGAQAFMSEEDLASEQRTKGWHDMPAHERFVQTNLLESDGADHRRLRATVFKAFTRQYVERHREMVQAYADQMVEAALEKGEIDFVADIALHMPGHIIGTILGVPAQDCPQLRIWSDDVVQFFGLERTEDDKKRAERATSEFHLYLIELIKARRRTPKNDLLSILIAAQDAGDLSETELIATAMLILMAGHGSTIDVMGSGCHALLRHPDQMRSLRDNAELMPNAVQEMFRFDTPLPFFHRYAAHDCKVAGYHIPQGTKVGLLYAAANRDPSVYKSPDTFEIARAPNHHLAFGMGAHLCLGNNLSRLDMEILFNTLLVRTKAIALRSDEVHYKTGISVRGPIALPVTLTPV